MYLLTTFIPPPNHTSVNHKFDLFFSMSLSVLRYSWPTHNISSWCTAQWFWMSVLFYMINLLSLLTICHHTKTLHDCWLDTPCVSYPWLIYFVTGSFHFIITSFLPPLSQRSVCSLYTWWCFCFVMFVHLSWFLDFT